MAAGRGRQDQHRVQKGPGKSRDSRTQILTWQKEKITLGVCHLPSLIHQTKMLEEQLLFLNNIYCHCGFGVAFKLAGQQKVSLPLSQTLQSRLLQLGQHNPSARAEPRAGKITRGSPCQAGWRQEAWPEDLCSSGKGFLRDFRSYDKAPFF